MPDLKTHKYIGAGAGAVYASYQAKDQPNNAWLLEVIGGGVGGYLGGMLPDKLEPALSSWHRGICHSWTAGGIVVSGSAQLAELAVACRKRAQQCRAIPTAQDSATGVFIPVPRSLLEQMFSQIGEILWTFLAGLLNGLAAGYLSHLLLDSATPRGIPLLGGRAALSAA